MFKTKSQRTNDSKESSPNKSAGKGPSNEPLFGKNFTSLMRNNDIMMKAFKD